MLCNHCDIRSETPAAYDRFSIVFLFVLSLLLMLKQFASSNYFTVVVSDAFIYPSWAWQFNEALKEGIVYPRWTPLNFWGYGSPTFLLYPPLAYYLVALFNLFTGSIITAMNAVKFTSLFLWGAGIYFLVKEFYPGRVALWSAVFCLVLPYNIAQMYIFGSFAAMVSCCWFSPILLLIYRYFKSGNRQYLILSGVCFGLQVLTHLVIAYMFAFVIAAFVLYLAMIRKEQARICALPVILLTGFSLSAAYILPVIFERKYLHLDVFTSGTYGYIYSNMFILPDLTSRFSDQGSFWPVYYSTLALYTAIFSIFCMFILLLMGVTMKYQESKTCSPADIANRFFLATAVCSILLMFGASSFLWETIPFFKYILFPTRWLDIIAFSASFLSATIFSAMLSDNKQSIKLLFILIILFSCLAWDFHYIAGAPAYDKKEPIAVNTVIEHLPNGVRLDKIDRTQQVGNAERIAVQGQGTANIVSWKTIERVVDVKAEKPVVVRFRTFNFPGWTAYLDGTRREISSEAATGAILLDVPGGRHQIKLVFRDTTIRLAGKFISIVTAILLIIILWSKIPCTRKAA